MKKITLLLCLFSVSGIGRAMDIKLETALYGGLSLLVIPVAYTAIHEFGHFATAKALGFHVTGFELNPSNCNRGALACVKYEHKRTLSPEATDRRLVAINSAGSLLNSIIGASILPLLSHSNLRPLFWLEFITTSSLLMDFPVYLLGDLASPPESKGDWRQIIQETHLEPSYFALLATAFLMTFLPLEVWRIGKGFKKYYATSTTSDPTEVIGVP